MIVTVCDDPIAELVSRARSGDQPAWNRLVERFSPLLWAVCRRHRLTGADAEDVAACVWLRLVERLGTIREPAALPGWLATTTARECLRVLRRTSRHVPIEEHDFAEAGPASDELLLVHERHVALRAAFERLPDKCRQLLSMLFGERPMPYAEIAEAIGTAVGGIGPNRQRCLDRLRRDPGLAAFLDN